MAAVDVLKSLGFKDGDVKEWQALAESIGMSNPQEGEPYTVLNAMTKGDVTAIIEKNVSEDENGGVVTVTKHPAVLILESPRGRVCIGNHDLDENARAIEKSVADLSAADR